MTIKRVHRARHAEKGILCPCCGRSSKRWDVWYDCDCFQGGNDNCDNCKLEGGTRNARIAATMREVGWDRNPSPGMRDYLTPGWRDSVPPEGDRGAPCAVLDDSAVPF